MIGDKLKERRLELGLTQQQLSLATGIKSTTISNYENNVSSPSEENVFKFMEVLKCDANYLFEWKGTDDFNITYAEKQNIKKYRLLDNYGKEAVDTILKVEYERCTEALKSHSQHKSVVSIRHSTYKVSAGCGFDLEDRDSWEEIEIPDTPEARKADFAVTIKGNSMEPLYSDGDIVLVRAQPAVDIGETGVYIINGGGFIKRYGGDRLISLNPEYDDILFTDNDYISCAGKVIGVV